MSKREQPKWEQRWHPLRREWVVLAAHRQNRPWSGAELERSDKDTPRYVDDCYLCPGNGRVAGAQNPEYDGVFVFTNDHPCVGPDAPEPVSNTSTVYKTTPAQGLARVICYGPEHDLRLGQLPLDRVCNLLHTWQQQYLELGQQADIKHVLIFENNGEAVGVSNPQPHCQVYATNFVFKTIEEEAIASAQYYAEHDRRLFDDIIAEEQRDGARVIAENDDAIAFVPWFARYAYEVYVVPKVAVASIDLLSESQRDGLAAVLKEVLIRFDNLWQQAFPYVLAVHNAPSDKADYSSYQMYISLHPPLRNPGLLKYLAGPEIGGGNFIADTWPDDSAAELQAVSNQHYLAAH